MTWFGFCFKDDELELLGSVDANEKSEAEVEFGMWNNVTGFVVSKECAEKLFVELESCLKKR